MYSKAHSMVRSAFTALMFAFALLAHAAQPDLLEPTEAFRFEARIAGPDAIEVHYRIAPGYYLYRDKLKFSADSGAVQLGEPDLPPGKRKHDEFFGEVETYRGDLRVRIPYRHEQGAEQIALTAVSQGCADVGVCYVPQEQKAVLRLAGLAGGTPEWGPADPAAASLFARGAAANDDLRVARIFDGAAWLAVLTFFGFGLLLAFTPCVLPMVPILSGIIVGHGHRVTRTHGFLLSLAYVLGMSLTYAVAGVIAGLSGALLSSALQNPWVLSAFATIFVVLAGGMLGWYKLQLPAAVQSRLVDRLNRLPGGRYVTVFVMGALSALIAGPCVAAPLAGALLYIGQSGNVALGGVALFAMAIGMGIPLLLIGVSAGALLPRVGPWMRGVQRFFGVVLLGVAIYFVSPLLSVSWQMGAWAVLLVYVALHLRVLDRLSPQAGAAPRFAKGMGIVMLVVGVVFLIGALTGAQDFRQPLPFLRAAAVTRTEAPPPAFRRIASVAELDAVVRAAAGKPVMLDFYADWCVSCKQMERDTFSDPRVRDRLERMIMLQADVTANSADHLALLRRFRLFGPPGIVFFDGGGREIEGLRVVGFQSPADFARVLDRALGAQ
ncbi:MAG TPA: protein-disulfide reductase DsbD [Burkholderiales bacterium]